jgi:hypothetical protein
MKLKIVTTVSSRNHPGLSKLEASLIKQGLDYKVIEDPNIGWDWGGWDAHRAWLNSEEARDYTHVIYTDGFDTLALAGQEEVENALKKILEPNPNAFVYSVEKHYYPHEDTDVAPKHWLEYHAMYINKQAYKDLPSTHRWRFVNGGQYGGSIEAVKNWYDNAPKKRNNQAWGNAFFAEDIENRLILDFNCLLFQTLSHSGVHHGSPEEFTIEGGRLTNNLTGTKPCFVHANGIKHPDELNSMYKILDEKSQ